MEQLPQLQQPVEQLLEQGPCVLVVAVAVVCHVVVVLVVLVVLVDVAWDLCLPGDVLLCLLDVQWEVVQWVDVLGLVAVVEAAELAQEDVLVVG